ALPASPSAARMVAASFVTSIAQVPRTGRATPTSARRRSRRALRVAHRPANPHSLYRKFASFWRDSDLRRLPPMRLLVTGAAGFIGSNFARDRPERRPGDHIVAFDLLPHARNRGSLPDEVPIAHVDTGDFQLVQQTLRDEQIGV